MLARVSVTPGFCVKTQTYGDERNVWRLTELHVISTIPSHFPS